MEAILAAALLAATLVSARAAPLNEEARKLLTDGMLNVCLEGTTRRVKESGKSHITQADMLNACNCFAVTVSRNLDSKDHLSEAVKQMISQTAEYCKVPYFGASDIKDTGTLGAVVLNRRGYAYHARGDHDRAIVDYDEAIRISPEYVPAYHNRGFAHFAKGELDHAIADYTEAIRLNQQYAISYRNRGIAHLYSGSPAKAQADLETATQLTPKSAYLALWREIVDRRANAPSTLAHAVSQIDMATWPAPIARFLLGESTQAALLASAKDSDPQKSRERLCETNFFVGQLALQRASKEGATRAFQIAARDCPPQFLEMGAAGAELRALGNKQGAEQPREGGRAGPPREGAMILTVIWMVVLGVFLLIWIARKPGSESHASSSAANASSTPAAAARERARQDEEEEERQKAAARERARQQEEEERQKVAARKRARQDEEERQKAAARERAKEEERQKAEAARKRQREQEEAAARERASQQEENERQTLAARKRQREQEEEERQKAAARERAKEEERQKAEAARKRQREQEEAAARERARQQEEQERRRNSSQGKISVAQALEIFGLNAGATKQEIRAAYKRLMTKVHPDHGGTNFFAKQLNEARETLRDAL